MRGNCDTRGAATGRRACSRQAFGHPVLRSCLVAALVVGMLIVLVSGVRAGDRNVRHDTRVGQGQPSRMSEKEAGQEVRLLFAGDILLSRQVRAEMERTGRNPWHDWPSLFHQADWVVGNLEGAVGSPVDCLKGLEPNLCFAIPETSLKVLSQAGFRAMGKANNHSGDLGEAGRTATRQALHRAGLEALSFEGSPSFHRFGSITVGVVAFSMVAGADSPQGALPSPVLRQKLRLARRLANLVVVFVHWGSELLEWPNAQQRRAAEWLIRQGADLIVGHHPHVIQPMECLQGKPVFFSLGNHLFDQKYPASKEGILADCRIAHDELTCGVIATQTPVGSAFPRISQAPPLGVGHAVTPKSCVAGLGTGFTVAGQVLRPVASEAEAVHGDGMVSLEALQGGEVRWKTRPMELLAVDSGRLAGPDGPELLVTLERHLSPLDREQSPRPYVYEVTPKGLVARWRGTALAWPLIDAALLPGKIGVLCALHRGDSYLMPNPATYQTRIAAYRWNGFGFSGVDDPETVGRCNEFWEMPASR
ncbi:MAG TPA: hypothetical protein DCZ69_08785, partial [Syntrophobacteraceae bacterium]|nr:hypothetical protein [Syntrophobacteraceae bacterium]